MRMEGELANGNSPLCAEVSVVMLFVRNEAFYKKTDGFRGTLWH